MSNKNKQSRTFNPNEIIALEGWKQWYAHKIDKKTYRHLSGVSKAELMYKHEYLMLQSDNVVFIKVNYDEKDDAKKFGAVWSPYYNSWYFIKNKTNLGKKLDLLEFYEVHEPILNMKAIMKDVVKPLGNKYVHATVGDFDEFYNQVMYKNYEIDEGMEYEYEEPIKEFWDSPNDYQKGLY